MVMVKIYKFNVIFILFSLLFSKDGKIDQDINFILNNNPIIKNTIPKKNPK